MEERYLYSSDFLDGEDRTLHQLDFNEKECPEHCAGAYLADKEVRYSHFWGTFNGEEVEPLPSISCTKCKELRRHFDPMFHQVPVLWFSRHEMSDEQRADLERIYGGDLFVYQVDQQIKSASELKDVIEKCSILAIVAPLNLQQEFLKLAGDKPVIISKSERIITKNDDGSDEKVIFQFKNWYQLKKIDVVMECL